MRVKMTIELELDDSFLPLDEDSKLWLENEIFIGDGNLILHSNEIGDAVGEIKSVKSIKYIDK